MHFIEINLGTEGTRDVRQKVGDFCFLKQKVQERARDNNDYY
jgi:hypothetical protein